MNLNSKDKENYWTKRSEQRLINSEKSTNEMLKRLKKVYKSSIQDIEKEINAFYGKYATETGLDITEVKKRLDKSELRSFKEQLQLYYQEVKRLGGYSPDTKQYLRELSAKAYISRLESLQAQIRWQVEQLYREQHNEIENNLKDGYKETYMRANFDNQQGIGFAYSFNALDDRKVRIAVNQNWQGSNFSDRIWADKAKLIETLNQTIPQGVALGQNPRVVARNISRTMDTRFSNAERLARTEMNHICNEASLEAYKETPDVLGQYKIVATLDNRTSDICQNQDGQVYKLSEWEEGITAPPFHPNSSDKYTEIYTKEGWKLFKDCTDDDLYFSINPETMIPEWLKAVQRISYRFTGNLIEFDNKYINQRVTPNHQMVVKSSKDNKIYFINAENMKLNDDYLIAYSLLDGNKEIKTNTLNKNLIPYDDMVYCVELPKYHTLLIRRNGKVCWTGNCRSTTIPFFDDVDYSTMSRIATDYETGKSYYISADTDYKTWRANLTENQNKYFIADKKAREQYKQDVQQAKEYRKLVTKANKSGYGDLFEGYKFDTKSLQELKYLNPDEYETVKSNMRMIRNL